MYSLEIEEEVFKAFKKLTKKDRKHLEAINKKIEQILSDTLQFKPLKHPLDGLMTPTETTGILAPLEAMKTAFLAMPGNLILKANTLFTLLLLVLNPTGHHTM